MTQQLDEVLAQKCETAVVDFKAGFDPSSLGEWLEIIKDVVAMANSGGGSILIGVSDEGVPSGVDIAPALAVDPADLTNKIFKYTGIHFHSFKIIPCERDSAAVCAICVDAARVPIVFTKVGTYEPIPGKQKNVFGVGAVYFRHGAKSEPATSDDLRAFLEREVEAVRRTWLDGIAKVVEAPAGARFAVLPPETAPAGPSGTIPIQLVDDPNAPAYYAVPIDTTHPYRQKEVIREVNLRLRGRRVITSHDILCVRRVFQVQKDVKFCYTQNYASPRYTTAFVDWIVDHYDADPAFFEKTKVEFDRLKSGG